MGLLDLFGFGSKKKIAIQEMLENNGLLIDVRTQYEFDNGHADGSICIPLNSIKHKANKLKAMKRPLVLICRSGARSGSASSYLTTQGIDCINGGTWRRYV